MARGCLMNVRRIILQIRTFSHSQNQLLPPNPIELPKNKTKMMFQEEEPGKPQNWCFTITVITIISLFNMAIFVVIRVLLDSENEFDEPIIRGKLREDLTQFLGIFSLTFCFGCWCCFCCTGHCFRCFLFLNPRRWKIGHWWATLMGHHFAQTTKMQFLRRKQQQQAKSEDNKEEQLELDNVSTLENGTGHQNAEGKSRSTLHGVSELDSSAEGTEESRKISPRLPSSANSSSSSGGGPVECPEQMENDATADGRPQRPTTLTGSDKKSSRHEEQQRFAAERVRRWSVAPVSADVLVAPMPPQSSIGGMARDRESSVIAVRGLDFYQVPIQMLTPSTVAIVDPGKLNQCFEAEGEEETPMTPPPYTPTPLEDSPAKQTKMS